MTGTLIFWFRIAILLLMAYTLFTYYKAARKRGYWLPASRKDWKDLAGDVFTMLAGLFALFMLERNYQQPIDQVMSKSQTPFPEISYRTSNTGLERRLSDHKGRLILLNLWATWCPPCRREMPELEKLEKTYAAAGLSVIALSDEDAATVDAFLREHPYSFQTGVLSGSIPETITAINTRPVSLLIGKDGKVLDMVVGARGFSFFEGWVKKQLTNASLSQVYDISHP